VSQSAVIWITKQSVDFSRALPFDKFAAASALSRIAGL
jgi:hypothetical protein